VTNEPELESTSAGDSPEQPRRRGPHVEIIGDSASIAKAFQGAAASRIPQGVAAKLATQLKLPSYTNRSFERIAENLRASTEHMPSFRGARIPTGDVRVPADFKPYGPSSSDTRAVVDAVVALSNEQRASNVRMFWMTVALVVFGAATVLEFLLR
jgi:hypothetical protein